MSSEEIDDCFACNKYKGVIQNMAIKKVFMFQDLPLFFFIKWHNKQLSRRNTVLQFLSIASFSISNKTDGQKSGEKKEQLQKKKKRKILCNNVKKQKPNNA